eukprot:c20718_g1_i1.p1 GENE.c20718_g1_i1~~c20718_g1_i1.p1  ORF type:complete len:781 (+),score=136.06 c20718_g1_i1:69-2345(+)
MSKPDFEPSRLRVALFAVAQVTLMFVISIIAVGPAIFPSLHFYRYVYGTYIYEDAYQAQFSSSAQRGISYLSIADVLVCFQFREICINHARLSPSLKFIAPLLFIPVGLLLWCSCLVVAAVLIKWTVLAGRLTPQNVPYWTLTHLRLWFVESFLAFVASILTTVAPDSLVLTAFYKLLGAKIAWSADISGCIILQPDLVTLSENCLVSAGAHLQPRVPMIRHLSYAPVFIGRGAQVQNGSVVHQAFLDDGVELAEYATVGQGTELSAGYWEGAPARLKNNKSPSVRTGLNKPVSALRSVAWFATLSISLSVAVLPSVYVHTAILDAFTNSLAQQGLRLTIAFEVGLSLVTLVVIGVLTKYALLGCVRVGDHKGVGFLLRHMVVHRLLDLCFKQVLVLFWHSPIVCLFYKLLGAQVSVRASIASQLADWDAVSIGPAVLTGGGVVIRASEVRGLQNNEKCNVLILPTTIGDSSMVAQKTTLGAGTNLGRECSVDPTTVTPASFSAVGCSRVGGAPAQVKSNHATAQDMDGSPMQFINVVLRGIASLFAIAVLLGLAYASAIPLMQLTEACLPKLSPSGLLIRTTGSDLLFLVVAASVILIPLIALVGLVVLKWVFVYRYHPDKLELFSFFGFRWYVVMFVWSVVTEKAPWIAGTPLLNLVLNLLGASVHYTAFLDSTYIYDWDLVRIAPFATTQQCATICPHVINSSAGGYLRVCMLGYGAMLQTNGLVLASMVSDEAKVLANTWTLPGMKVRFLAVQL